MPLLALVLSLAATASGSIESLPPVQNGYLIERDIEIARAEPGPHQGTGRTTGHPFFESVPDLEFAFRKRVLHPGASIGAHLQEENEVYHVLSGRGVFTVDGKTIPVGAGDALLTLPGSSHALAQSGSEDLVIIIVYPVHRAP